MRILTGFLFLAIVTACTSEVKCIDESQINEKAFCTMEYAPVCGCDGVTYGNDCQAKNNGVLRWEAGECLE